MKKIFLLTALVALFTTACNNNDLPEANFSLFQAENLTAESGDGSVSLSWTLQSGKPAPIDQIVSWTTNNDAAEDGEMIVDASTTSVVINNLVNESTYTFYVQTRYPEGLALKISASCTPKSTRIAPSNLKIMAGDSRVFISWVAPETKLDFKYNLMVTATGAAARNIEVASTDTSYLVDNLTNGTEYTFTLTAVYAHGSSDSLSGSATPGDIDPIVMVCASNPPHVFELCTFDYNPAYFVSGEIASAKWTFDDGGSFDGDTATYCFATAGSHTVTITITYADGTTESSDMTIEVVGFAWDRYDTPGSYQKSNGVVFSHDGQTFYAASSTNPFYLYAVDVATGVTKWTYNIAYTVYGEGPMVGPDGTIYVGTENGPLFAVTSSGEEKWQKSFSDGEVVRAAPAITSDGTLYVVTTAGTLYALNGATGSEKWNAKQSGTPSGVVVGKDGTVFFATYNGIWAYTESGTLKWSNEKHSVTERGGALAIYENMLYASLRAKAGVAALDLATGNTLWTYASEVGDCYHPVVDAEGSVYICEKSGYIYIVKKDGTLKTVDRTTPIGYIYNAFAIAENGKAYITQYTNGSTNLLVFDTDGSSSIVMPLGPQTMSAVAIGPDQRLYYGSNGYITATAIGSPLSSKGWPCRGYDAQGTNSLK